MRKIVERFFALLVITIVTIVTTAVCKAYSGINNYSGIYEGYSYI